MSARTTPDRSRRSQAPTPPSIPPLRPPTPPFRDDSTPPCSPSPYPPEMFEELAEIEERLEDVEIDILRKNYLASKKIYDDRTTLILKIPHFWALVLEEAPEDIDCRIQPRDTAVLGALKSLQVTRFEIEDENNGEPRSVQFTFTFEKNGWFHDEVLEKKFWHRKSQDGWSGLVSEPVKIHWKEGKDLTDGLLDKAIEVCAEEVDGGAKSEKQDALVETMESMPMDAVSFFAWFGYLGRKVSAEESCEVIRKEKEKRANGEHGDDEGEGNARQPDLRSALEKTIATDENPDDAELSYDIFPGGGELAIALSDDLYPNAIKYFTQGQEANVFDSEDEEVVSSDEDLDEPVTKKAKMSK